MNVLIIGGTGTISAHVTKRLLALGNTVVLLNRGNKPFPTDGTEAGKLISIQCDINSDTAAIAVSEALQKCGADKFDATADFIAYDVEACVRDYKLLRGKTKQHIFISTASAYNKPVTNYIITESTPLCNPYWEYSRKKIACETYLTELYRSGEFPVTIVRPSHTYGDDSVPTAIHGDEGSFSVIKRIIDGKSVIIPGDGSSLWTVTNSRDFAVGFCGLVGNVHAIGEAFHITSDESLSWNQIYRTIADTLSKELHPVYVTSTQLVRRGNVYGYDFEGGLTGDKSCSVVFDNSKIKRYVPEYSANIRFDRGVRMTLAHILRTPDLQKPDPKFDEFCDELTEMYR